MGKELAATVKVILILTAAFVSVGVSSAHAQSCEEGHWVAEVLGDGSLVKLEDGSLWEVDSDDTVTASLWLSPSDVIVCDDRLINTDDNESVHARRLR